MENSKRETNRKMKKYIVQGGLSYFSDLFSLLIMASEEVRKYLYEGRLRKFLSDAPALNDFESTFGPIEEAWTIEEVIASLSFTVMNDKYCGVRDEQGEHDIDVSLCGVKYSVTFYKEPDEWPHGSCVSDEIKFGWENDENWEGDGLYDDSEYSLTVYCMALEGSTLEKSLVRHGFYLESEMYSDECLRKQWDIDIELFQKSACSGKIPFCDLRLNAMQHFLVTYKIGIDLCLSDDGLSWREDMPSQFTKDFAVEIDRNKAVLFHNEGDYFKPISSEKELMKIASDKRYARMAIELLKKKYDNF